MSDTLARIRAKVGERHLGGSCSRDGCRVFMTDVPSPRVVADSDRAFPGHGIPGRRCDFVLFFQTAADVLVIVPMELKSGADMSGVAEQLQAGATFAERVTPETPDSIFRPILFHGRGLHAKQRQALNRAKVRFRGVDLSIKTARCGRPRNLAAALAPYCAV